MYSISSVGSCFNATAQGRMAWFSPVAPTVGSFTATSRRHAPPGLTFALQALLLAYPAIGLFDHARIVGMGRRCKPALSIPALNDGAFRAKRVTD
jgi:hypothetical protein